MKIDKIMFGLTILIWVITGIAAVRGDSECFFLFALGILLTLTTLLEQHRLLVGFLWIAFSIFLGLTCSSYFRDINTLIFVFFVFFFNGSFIIIMNLIRKKKNKTLESSITQPKPD